MAEQTVTETGNQANPQMQMLAHQARQAVKAGQQVEVGLLFLYYAISDRKTEFDEATMNGLGVIIDLLGDRVGQAVMSGREVAAALHRMTGEVAP